MLGKTRISRCAICSRNVSILVQSEEDDMTAFLYYVTYFVLSMLTTQIGQPPLSFLENAGADAVSTWCRGNLLREFLSLES